MAGLPGIGLAATLKLGMLCNVCDIARLPRDEP